MNQASNSQQASQPAQQSVSIKEAAKLYGLTIDTLYYYERIGLVVPARNPANGYRMYGGEDFYRLNIVTDLLGMGFSLAQVKNYFEHHTFSSTIALMNNELASIDAKVTRLNEKKDSVIGSMQRYANAMAQARAEHIQIAHMPARECLLVSNERIQYDLVPHAFALCAKAHGMKLGALHTTPCYVVDTTRPIEGLGCFEPTAILLYSENLPCEPDFTLPAGLYASCTFQGSFAGIQTHYQTMQKYIEEQGYVEQPGAVEFCLIGEYESNDPAEYVSRIEVPVSTA